MTRVHVCARPNAGRLLTELRLYSEAPATGIARNQIAAHSGERFFISAHQLRYLCQQISLFYFFGTHHVQLHSRTEPIEIYGRFVDCWLLAKRAEYVIHGQFNMPEIDKQCERPDGRTLS